MDQKDEVSEYKGHSIRITVSVSHGRWRWLYVLDGSDLHEIRGRGCSTADIAIAEAQDDARRRVDAMH